VKILRRTGYINITLSKFSEWDILLEAVELKCRDIINNFYELLALFKEADRVRVEYSGLGDLF
jgi:hypothetical protein